MNNDPNDFVHKWLRQNYGKANKCQNIKCPYTSHGLKKFHWAKIEGKKYERNANNFVMLCPSCHTNYDKGYLKIDSKNFDKHLEISFEPDYIPLKEKISELREKLGDISRLTLSKLLGLKGPGIIFSWEKGIGQPSFERCLKLIKLSESVGLNWKITEIRK